MGSHVDFMKINRPTFLCSQLWNKNFIVLNLLNLSNKQTFLWAYFQLRNGDKYKTLQPQEFYKTFLDRKTRPDGRDLLEFRSTTLTTSSIGTADGSSIVKCGNTTIICGIKAEVAPPLSEEPSKGFIV